MSINSARLVRQRKEPAGRYRFLSREEYNRLCDVVRINNPDHLADLIVSVNSGMRLTEQYTVTWGQVHMDRRTIELTKTKNGSARTVRLNADALAAIRSIRPPKPKASDLVFPHTTKAPDVRPWFQPALEEAKSLTIPGMAIGTRCALGLPWPGQPSKKYKKQPGTRPLKWRPATPTSLHSTRSLLSSESQHRQLPHWHEKSTVIKTAIKQNRPLNLSGHFCL
ncbi:MAG: tyrosine-type recombinase/integrase [Acidobacteriaceae bacterium]